MVDRVERPHGRHLIKALWSNGTRPLVLVTAGCLGALAVIVVLIIVNLLSPGPNDPLGDFPTQVVTSRVPGVKGPAVRIGQPLHVTAIKCADEPTATTGEYRWALRAPLAGLTVLGSKGVGLRTKGCATLQYEDPMPDAVIDKSRKLLAQGVQPIWAIVGKDTPIDQTGRPNGLSRSYISDNFQVVP